MRKSPTQRFGSAAEILGALSVESQPPTPDRRTFDDIAVAVRWWRAHQYVVIGLYFLACVSAWFSKEGLGTAADVVFGIVTTVATVGGVLRGHLLFVDRTKRRALPDERRRTDWVTLWTDALIAIALVVDAVLLSMTTSHVAAALSAALGIGILLGRLWIEPSSADEAFGTPAFLP